MSETPPPAATPDGADPSMEDILASIRRILNEEEVPAEAAAPVEAPADDDVLVLDESMMVSAGEHSRDGLETEPEPERPAPKPVPKIDELPAAHVEPSAIELEPSAGCGVQSNSPGGSAGEASRLDGPGNRRRCHGFGWQSDPILVGWPCYESIFGWTDA